MRRHLPPSPDGRCVKCGCPIVGRRADAAYCSRRCVAAAEKLRFINSHPEYKDRQRQQVRELKHIAEHGHPGYIGSPLMNPKDRFRVARSLGYRSMLEVGIARQLDEFGIDAKACYESLVIHYKRPTMEFRRAVHG